MLQHEIRFYNAKTKTYYKSSGIYVVGKDSEAAGVIVACGFFHQMIHIDDGGPISSKCQFVVGESVPKDWTGEIVQLADFSKTIKTFAVKKTQARSTKQVKSAGCGCSRTKSTEPVQSTCPPTHCRWAMIGDLAFIDKPCRGRRVVCRHQEAAGMARLEISCRPPDAAKDLVYNLRSCVLHEKQTYDNH